MLKTLVTVSLMAAASADTCLSQTGTYTHAIRCLNGRVKVNDFSQRRCDWEADTTHRCQEECCQDTCAVQTATGASPATCAAGFALKTDYRNIPCTVATCPTVCCEKTCSHSDYAATCTTGFQKKVNAASIPCSTGDLGCDQTYCCDKTPAADNLDELRATARHDLVWCLEDSDCRKHDKGAKCLANGDCECSKDFLPFVTATGYTVDRCFPVNEDKLYTVNVIAEKPVGGCTVNAIAPQSALTMIAAVAANRTGGVVRSINGYCHAPHQPSPTDIPAGNRYAFVLLLDYPKYLPTLTELPMRTSKDSRVALDAELPEWNKRLLPYTTAELAPIGGKVIDLVIDSRAACRTSRGADALVRAGNWFMQECVDVQCPKGQRRNPTANPLVGNPCVDHAAADAAPDCVTATDCHFLYKKKADRTAANTVKRDVACVANKCVDRTDLGFMKKRLSGPVQADWCQTSGQCTVGGDANATCSQNAQLGNWCDCVLDGFAYPHASIPMCLPTGATEVSLNFRIEYRSDLTCPPTADEVAGLEALVTEVFATTNVTATPFCDTTAQIVFAGTLTLEVAKAVEYTESTNTKFLLNKLIAERDARKDTPAPATDAPPTDAPAAEVKGRGASVLADPYAGLGNAQPFSASLSSSNPCASDFATQATLDHNGQCVALACEAGYALHSGACNKVTPVPATDAPATKSPFSDPAPAEDDGGLRTGHKVGIALGVTGGVLLIAGIIVAVVMCTKKKPEDAENAPENADADAPEEENRAPDAEPVAPEPAVEPEAKGEEAA
eukprot:Rhum_TRINITY_DN15272_c2_g1::Rhum_TRINITY_DN15272_c2_g1_i6::g.148264::m.148264